jgi:protein SCO1/2
MAKHLAAVTLGAALLVADPGRAAEPNGRYAMRGMVMKVAPSHKSFVVSHDSIPGVMEAMTMSFDVRQPDDLEGVAPGVTVEFTLVVGRESAYAEHVRIRRYETVEQDPLTARRLKLLKDMTTAPGSAVRPLTIGQPVPDFTLTDQARHQVTLSAFRGKVVAINFIYTSCALPQFCFRIANHFGVIQRRFKQRLGRDLVLLTVTFDPVRDQPERLAEYASQWQADATSWHFLTGAVPDVKRVCGLFGVDFFPDEGVMNHSSHTAVVDRQGHLAATIEGNEFSATQLGDLVEHVLKR